MAERNKMPLRRHHDDDYCDRVLISAGDVRVISIEEKP